MNLNKKIKKFEETKIEIQNSIDHIQPLLFPSENIINLNVGGTHFVSTSKSNLCKFKSTGLYSIFSQEYIDLPKKDDMYFIDRDGNVFLLLIDYLRNGVLPQFRNEEERILFDEEKEFWGFPKESFGK